MDIAADEDWPCAGMSIWAYPDDTEVWSRFSNDPRGRQSIMDSGFLMATIELVGACERDPSNSIPLVYPALFSLRHGVELGLKSIIDWYSAYADVSVEKRDHSISTLWTAARKIIETIVGEGDQEALDAMEAVVMELHDIDPASFTFRYASDKKGRPLPLPQRVRVHMPNIGKVARAIDGFFLGVDGALDHATSA